MPIVRLPNGDLRDEIRVPLYDTLSFGPNSFNPTWLTPNAADQQQFFTNIQNKAKWQTNLTQPNLLETAVSFRVQGLAMDVQYVNTAQATVKNSWLPSFMDYSSLRLHIGEKDYWEGPLVYLMGRLCQNAAVADVAKDILFYESAGQPAVQGVILSGRHVIDINPLQSFYGVLSVDLPAGLDALQTLTVQDSVNAKMSLKGLKRRPVQ